MADGSTAKETVPRLDLPEPVSEELRTLERVRGALARREAPHRVNYAADLLKLRDSLGEERLDEDRASILEQMHRLSRLAVQQQKLLQMEAVDDKSPYFGHMRLDDYDGRRREILVGKRTFVSDGVTIVDWRNAPISKIFYQSEAGDEYELRIDSHELAGVVAVRRTVTIQNGELLRVSGPEGTWVLSYGEWVEARAPKPELAGGAGVAARPDRTEPVLGVEGSVPVVAPGRTDRADKHLPAIASLLDAEQFDLITRPDAGVIAIQGSAGSGKTTVALHRVAYLAFHDPRRFAPRRTQVLVGSRALSTYISKVLPALGVEGVPVDTLQNWLSRLRWRHFSRLPRRYAEDTPSVVTRLKLHSALIPLLREAAEAQPDASPAALFDELFTNRDWYRRGFDRHAPGAFSADELDQVHLWCTTQHYKRIDGEEPGTLDEEDDAILLRLHQVLRGPLRRDAKRRLGYAHLVVDEVQDCTPLELAVLIDTVKPGGPITLAGDTAQRLSDAVDFRDWRQVLETLGLRDVEISPLEVSYRSTVQIMTVARAVLGPLAPAEPVRAPRHGAPVELFRFPSPGEASTFLVEACRGLILREPTASLAVLARYPEQADEIYAVLERADVPHTRRVSDQDFAFAPGIEVTEIHQTKGLEFDYVIVLNADAQTFPVTPSSRHLMHVGITRAAHQCWLTSVGTPSRLLPEWLEARQP